MALHAHLIHHVKLRRRYGVPFVSILVLAHGLFILATTMLDQLADHHGAHLSDFVFDLPLLVGISLIYLSSLLRKRKRNAWLVTIAAYTFYLGVTVTSLLNVAVVHHISSLVIARVVVLPIVIVFILFIFKDEFVVLSDTQGFRSAAQISLIILVAALVYGTGGMLLLDTSDFHQEINVPQALHYTIDQFDLTTNKPLHPYTRRAHVFIDSLSVVSTGAVIYVAISFFQPLRLRLTDQQPSRKRLEELLEGNDSPSEDYFKLWPHDKQYFFEDNNRSGLAYHVSRGVALCLGDPVGEPHSYGTLLDNFQALNFGNDWTPAFIHIEDKQRALYEARNFTLQKIGQEAVVDLALFETTARNKYFRHITNKFTKQGFTAELLQPPHHKAVIDRLRVISDDWLSHGGRTERGFVMGYFSEEYLQACPIMVVRDAAGTIQAFLNQLPAHFDTTEATYDMLRHADTGIGNINDFLLLNFAAILRSQSYQRLNLGLCPLVGIADDDEERKGLLDSILGFAYANGDRIYSFSGLYRFKAKYEPEWRDRFIAYQGGLRGFTKTLNALNKAMSVKHLKTKTVKK